MMKKAYLLGRLSQSLYFNDCPPMALSWAEGMIGAFPVFDSVDNMKKYLEFLGMGECPYSEIELDWPEVQ